MRALSWFVLAAVPFALSCKVRKDPGSQVLESGSGAGGGGQEALDAFFARFDRDMKTTEATLLAGEPEGPSDGSAYALSGFDNAAIGRAARDLGVQLKTKAGQSQGNERTELESLAIELEAMAFLAEANLPNLDPAKISNAIGRAQALLGKIDPAETTTGATGQQADPEKQAANPPPAAKEIDFSRLSCVKSDEGGYLPQIDDNGQRIGVVGFRLIADCENAIKLANDGLICSISDTRTVATFQIRTGQQIGTTNQATITNTCLWSTKLAANGQVCVVDSSNGNLHAKFDSRTNKLVSYWHYSVQRCMRGDKSKTPWLICREGCQSTRVACDARVPRARQDSARELDNSLARLEESMEHLKCSTAQLECTTGCQNKSND